MTGSDLDVLHRRITWVHDNRQAGVFMTAPISIRLDPGVREMLEAEARAQGIGLATYLRQRAAKAARDVRRARIRAGSAAVAQHVATDRGARAFMDDWGTPDPES